MNRIRKAAVLGAGTMGAAIAAHLAGCRIPTLLLDVVPTELTDEEKKKRLTLAAREVRDRITRRGLERVCQATPPALFLSKDVELMTTGNIEDDLSRLAEADWIVEAVVEDLQVKRELLQKVERHVRPGTIVSTNTSGLSINRMTEGLSDVFRRHFLGTHFFNPPRSMALLELIPGRDTLPEVVTSFANFAERILGKRVVLCKDTPCFIANRIGAFSKCLILKLMVEDGYTIEEVDTLTGPILGRPRTATFRTADLVGLDVSVSVVDHLYESLEGDERRDRFRIPPFVREMVERGWLGNKAGQGFYKRMKGPGKDDFYVLDYRTMEYRPQEQVSFPALEAVQGIEDAGARIKRLAEADDRAGRFVWKLLSEIATYAANRIPEIADDLVSVDRAMRWGYHWELGPFETWDALGVEEGLRRMEGEGRAIPPLIQTLREAGARSFYQKRDGRLFAFQAKAKSYQEVEERPEVIPLKFLKEAGKVVASNPSASLIDLGDGIACLELHSKLNTIGPETIQMLKKSLSIVEEQFEGLVIGNQGRDFSVGANLAFLLFSIQNEEWDEIERAVKVFQDALMAVKTFHKPVVAAPFGRTLAGGCEICLASPTVQAAAETSMGLVEVGVGLIPAGGGTKEMLLRALEAIPEGVEVDLYPFVRFVLETIAQAKVSTSAMEARRLRFLRPSDHITINKDFLLFDAKMTTLAQVREGFRPLHPRRDIKVLGERGRAAVEAELHNMRVAEFISDYDVHLLKKLAYVLSGGEAPSGALVSEQYLLDLEREAFLSLCGEPKTQERIRYRLAEGKPLRN
ncbi:MAG: 3-hydroxyacyl-CoA dehydrogenase/enoyl-CoA hydratase family protein [candidate division NC10 bacterium]|nr:3-hydroxyacyl-CoA dehydrogenase/enoyl-CoA hydratase family protein [candidate division NC10 bacterium]